MDDVAAVEAVELDPVEERSRWFPLLLPAIGYNSTDGVGFGVGGEVYSRPPGQAYGYRWKLTGGSWTTLGFDYLSHHVRFDWRDEQAWLGKVGYRSWNDLVYAGVGGEDAATLRPAGVESGNRVAGPYAFVGVAFPLDRLPLAPYVQGYFRSVGVTPAEGGLLDERDPYGAHGGVYGDVTVGVELDTTDRWPLPIAGTRAEIGVSAGWCDARRDDVEPLGGVHAEVQRWQPLAGERLVIGGRAVADHSVGRRPFFEQEVAGGRWRDELGYDQILSGYGRTRTRGDGVVAALVEVRPLLGRTDHAFWDLAAYLSLFAEQAWLFHGFDPGPPMPSVGVGPEVVWQRALQVRPFVAWGWRSEADGGGRRPVPQLGVSFLDPL